MTSPLTQPPSETLRLATLHGLGILDSAPEPAFERIADIARRVFHVPMATISLVDAERQWFKARRGIDVCETARGISFCTLAIEQDEVFVVPDAQDDFRFAKSPLVTGPPHIRFYAGAPLIFKPGVRPGTLCIMDTSPRKLSEDEGLILKDLAAFVVDELRLRLNTRRLSEQADVLAEAVGGAGKGIVVVDKRGKFTMFNSRAEELLGKGSLDVDPSAWSQAYQLYREDGVTQFPLMDLPLARALLGESTENVVMIVRNPKAGHDVRLSAAGRPIFDAAEQIQGAMVTFAEIKEGTVTPGAKS